MRDYFVKLDHKLLTSSIMDEDVEVRWVWIVCLLLSEDDGRFRATAAALARQANVPIEVAERALEVLSSPDPNSTTTDHGGKRLLSEGPNRWLIPNKARYRRATDDEAVRAYERDRKRRQRSRDDSSGEEGEREETKRERESVPDCPGQVRDKKSLGPVSRHPPTLEEVRSYALEYMSSRGLVGRNPAERFFNHFVSNGWKVSGRSAMKDWRHALRNWVLRDVDDGKLRQIETPPEADEWVVDTYRRADLEAHGHQRTWDLYIEDAMNITAERGPRTAPTFEEWRSSRDG